MNLINRLITVSNHVWVSNIIISVLYRGQCQVPLQEVICFLNITFIPKKYWFEVVYSQLVEKQLYQSDHYADVKDYR